MDGKIALVALGALAVAGARAQAPDIVPRMKPILLQGRVRSIAGNVIVLDVRSGQATQGRQVDISGADFQTADGKSVTDRHVRVGEAIVVLINGNVPTESRSPEAPPGFAHSHHVLLLPLRAVVLERAEPGS